MWKDTQHYAVYDDGPVYTSRRNPSEDEFDIPIEETEDEERRAILLRYPEITNQEFAILKDMRRTERMKKIVYAKHMAELEFKRQISIREEEAAATTTTVEDEQNASRTKTKMMTMTTTTLTTLTDNAKGFEGASSQQVSSSTTTTASFFSATSQQPPSTNPDILKAREFYNKSNCCYYMKFSDMHSLYELESYLNTRILYQTDAVADISRTLWMLKDDSVFSDPLPCILSLLMAGTTGTGKTHSVNIIRNVLEMDSHAKHADCYIEYRGGSCSDDSTLNQLTGASPGYLGFKDKDCETLCDKLKRACDHYKDALAHINPSYNTPLPKDFYEDDDGGDDEEATAAAIAKKRPFCVVLLFIDEADKATKKVWNVLNSLLSDGCINDASDGKIFTIPRGIKVLVCITGNFGADMMIYENANNEDHYERVKEWVLMDLNKKGYADCDIARFAKNIIPFFPPSQKDINIILIMRFYKHLLSDENRFNKKYGKATIKDDDLLHYIRTFIDKYNQPYGIRQAHDTLDKDLKQFAGQNLHHFDTYLDKRSLPLDTPPQLSFKSIPFSENLSQEELGRTDPDINIAVRDSVNLRNLKGRLKSKNNVDFLTMTHPLIAEPSVNILSAYQTTIVYNDNRQYNCDPNFLEKFEKVLNEKKDSQDRLICMGNALREVCDIIECDEDTTDDLKRKVDKALVQFLPKRKSLQAASTTLTITSPDSVLMIEDNQETSLSPPQSPLKLDKDNGDCVEISTMSAVNDESNNMVIASLPSPPPPSLQSPTRSSPLKTSPIRSSPLRTSPMRSSPIHSSTDMDVITTANIYPIVSPSLYQNRRYSPSVLTLKRKKSNESDDDNELNGILSKRPKTALYPYLPFPYYDEYDEDDDDGEDDECNHIVNLTGEEELFDCLYCGKAKECDKFPKSIQSKLKKHIPFDLPVSCTTCIRKRK